jgi:predicted porin
MARRKGSKVAEMKRKVFIGFVGLLIAFQLPFAGTAFSAGGTVDAKTVERLENLIKAQQQQLELLQQEVAELKKVTADAQTQAMSAKAVADEMKTASLVTVEKAVTSGSDKVKLAISGQVNRAMNVVDDGDDTEAYFVDNSASGSRFRLVGTAVLNDDLTLGTRMELGFAPNSSSKVNQDDMEIDDLFDQRYADISLASKRFGKLFLGKGDTSSNNTAEVDLSGTDVVQYASIADIAGGMLFVQSSDDKVSGIKVKDAFKDFDGLSRKDRLRYDTPKFKGAHLSASWISDKRWDTALWWGGEGYGFKMGAAAAIAYINTEKLIEDSYYEDSDYQYDGSFSILHENTGLNFTLSGGMQEVDHQSDPNNVYAKIGWRTDLISYGKTSFGVDYAWSDNITAENDDGNSFGIAAVQQFNDYGAELYAQFRNFSLNRDVEPNVEDLNVFTVGTRVKF